MIDVTQTAPKGSQAELLQRLRSSWDVGFPGDDVGCAGLHSRVRNYDRARTKTRNVSKAAGRAGNARAGGRR